MLFAGMVALAGAAVVDHARSARRQSKGLGPGLVPLRTRPRSWGAGGVRGLPPLPYKASVGSSPRVRVARASFLGCPLLSWAALYCCCRGERVPPLLVSVLVRRWRSCKDSRWGVVLGGGSNLSGDSVAVGVMVSCGTGNQSSLNLRVLTGLRPPLVTLSLRCWIIYGSVAANIRALPLSGFPHLSLPLSCGV